MSRSFGALVAIALLAPALAGAATLRVPTDYATINAALDAAASGDTVLVAPGTYSDYETRLNPDGAWISAVAFATSGVVLTSEGGAAVTTLRLDAAASFPRLLYGYPLDGPFTLSGFTLTGDIVGLRCIQVHGSGTLRVLDCEFRDFGTGASNETGMTVSTNLEVRRCIYRNIDANTGGGLAHGLGSILIEDSEFSNCRSGAVSIRDGGPVTVRRTRFVNNVKTTGGGGAAFVADRTSVLFEDCWFEGNQSIEGSASGGAVAMAGAGSDATIRDCTFVANYTDTGHAGGLWTSCRAALIEGNTFWANAQGLNWSQGGACIFVANGASTVRRNIIAGSTGDEALGKEQGTVDTECNIFWENPIGHTFGFPLDPTDVVADPQFCDAPSLDFTVNELSPCLPGNGNASCIELIGAWGEGCGSVSVDPVTWGTIKNGFRNGSEEAIR